MNLNGKPTQDLVEDWMSLTTGAVHYSKACDEQFSRVDYPHLRMIFKRMKDKGLVDSVVGRDGYYEWVGDVAQPLDWQNLPDTGDSGLILPFDLRDYVFIYPDTVIVVAGSKSSGKTGFLYRTIAMNIANDNFEHIELLTNLEGGLALLRDRFNSMDIKIPQPAPFTVRNVNDKFHVYIKQRNTIYVIDYIDAPEGTDFYLIAAQIKKIDQRLQGLNSVAIVGLQKPMMRDIGFGGEQTMKNASLYIALDSKKLKIVDAKVPADNLTHPKNMTFEFSYSEAGTNFTNIKTTWV